jgi:hypothetical protein
MRISGHKTAHIFRTYDIASEVDLIEATKSRLVARSKLTQKLTHRLFRTKYRKQKPTLSGLKGMAGTTRLELATSAVTGCPTL